jgi:3-methyladenine DNA glycosylase AlkC
VKVLAAAPPVCPPRLKARRFADVTPELRAALESGAEETATLAEQLSIDLARLLAGVFPHLADLAEAGIDRRAGYTRRMAMAAEVVRSKEGPDAFDFMTAHASDTVRGWAAYLLAAVPDLSLADRLAKIRPLADDRHFGVREWAWIALRPHIATNVREAIGLLCSWVEAPSANIRRFAVESTRPRGVWCAHIPDLKAEPHLGRPLLEPLKDEPGRYVQDSVANWLNDAARSQPAWVRDVIAEWRAEGGTAVDYIGRRALRSLPPA